MDRNILSRLYIKSSPGVPDQNSDGLDQLRDGFNAAKKLTSWCIQLVLVINISLEDQWMML